MRYREDVNDIIYPRSDRTPAVLRYRIALFDQGVEQHAVIYVTELAQHPLPATEVDAAIDSVLNKIITTHFTGVRVDHLRMVVESKAGLFEYPIDFDVTEFAQRGNTVSMVGSGKTQSIHVDMSNVLGGSVTFFCSANQPRVLSKELADALA
jgi:hypothetical protein